MEINNIFHEFLRSRRSIRRFLQKPVEKEKIYRIIETAMCAPSAHNRQPWRFAVISDNENKIKLGREMGLNFSKDLAVDGIPADEIEKRVRRSIDRIQNSPVIIILFLDMTEMDFYPSTSSQRVESEKIMGIQSVAAAGMLLQLAAQAENLSTVWTCSPLFASEKVKFVLNTPEEWDPQAMFFVGYSAETPKNKSLKLIDSIIKYY